jgi:DNA adenine methylase
MTAPRRPLLRYLGGKFKLAPWIVEQFPPHRVYVEPFGGAASVLLRKPRAFAEVYNDLDGETVNLFRVLRSDRAAELVRALSLTPFAREEFGESYAVVDDPVERARRLVCRSFMGFGSGATFRRPTGFRANANASGRHNTAAEWAGYPEALVAIIERLRGVVIENSDAVDVMRRSDRDDTLHYVDPPYVPATRSPTARRAEAAFHAYEHELTEQDHVALLAALRELRGMVVLSGYPSELYDAHLQGWHRIERDALADGARPRTEVLWINPACVAAKSTLPPANSDSLFQSEEMA